MVVGGRGAEDKDARRVNQTSAYRAVPCCVGSGTCRTQRLRTRKWSLGIHLLHTDRIQCERGKEFATLDEKYTAPLMKRMADD
jgi:hypothetical protein